MLCITISPYLFAALVLLRTYIVFKAAWKMEGLLAILIYKRSLAGMQSLMCIFA